MKGRAVTVKEFWLALVLFSRLVEFGLLRPSHVLRTACRIVIKSSGGRSLGWAPATDILSKN